MNFTMYANFSRIFKEEGIARAIEVAKELNFSSVEFIEWVADDWESCIKDVESAREVKRELCQNGLSVACYSVAVTLWEEEMNPDTVTEAEKALYRYAEIAAAAGSPLLHHTLIMTPVQENLSFDEALRCIVPAAIRVAKYAYSLGVRCIYEPQGRYFNGIERFGALYRAIKAECPYVGVCGDAGNLLYVDESPVEFIRTYRNDILHVHIKDCAPVEMREDIPEWSISSGGVPYVDCVVGTGCIDLEACLTLLKEVGYHGAFGFENGPVEEHADGVRAGRAILKKIFDEGC